MPVVTTIQPGRKHVDADRTFGFSMSHLLRSGFETLSGTPTVTVSPAGLAVDDIAVNATEYVAADGETIPAGEGVLMRHRRRKRSCCRGVPSPSARGRDCGCLRTIAR